MGSTPDGREEIVKNLDELTARYVETHDPEVREQIYRSIRKLEKLGKQSDS